MINIYIIQAKTHILIIKLAQPMKADAQSLFRHFLPLIMLNKRVPLNCFCKYSETKQTYKKEPADTIKRLIANIMNFLDTDGTEINNANRLVATPIKAPKTTA